MNAIIDILVGMLAIMFLLVVILVVIMLGIFILISGISAFKDIIDEIKGDYNGRF